MTPPPAMSTDTAPRGARRAARIAAIGCILGVLLYAAYLALGMLP